MRAFLQKRYCEIKESYLRDLGYVVPVMYHSSFVHWGGGTEVQFIYQRLLGDLPAGAKVLLIGVMGGRDFFLLKNLGYDVVALDLGPQPEIEPIIFCNVEDRLPFDDGTFDAVLAGEVLEHLRDDVKALDNIRRVLKPDGVLVISVPFYNDWEEGHMRIHSPESARRLLRMGGFVVEQYLERPGVITLRFLNIFQHGLSLLSYLLTRRTAYPWLTRSVGEFEWKLGRHTGLRFLRRFSKSFGGYYRCRPAVRYDHVALNRQLYTRADATVGAPV